MSDALVLLVVAAAICIVHLLLDARRADSRRRAQLQGIELRADTSQRFEYARAIRATGGGSW